MSGLSRIDETLRELERLEREAAAACAAAGEQAGPALRDRLEALRADHQRHLGRLGALRGAPDSGEPADPPELAGVGPERVLCALKGVEEEVAEAYSRALLGGLPLEAEFAVKGLLQDQVGHLAWIHVALASGQVAAGAASR